jgi:serine/threonine-protein kinase
MDCDVIDEQPEKYLRSIGTVFAEFGALTQDSVNVSYGVQVGAERYFVKTAGRSDDPRPFLNHTARVALLRNAVRLSESCHHPTLPRLYRVIESPSGPLLIYQWLDGELLGVPRARRDNLESAFQRFRSLPAATIQGILYAIFDLHRKLACAGWIAVDFYDGCLIYDFKSGRLGIVDLDMYREGPFRNEMGRMFGSTRFMAHEEFELGGLIDERTNVFVSLRWSGLTSSGASNLQHTEDSRSKWRRPIWRSTENSRSIGSVVSRWTSAIGFATDSSWLG